ncbi:MAG: hypothetical protein ACK4PI_03215 [Tepidisphaerales bacterium]
MVTLGRLELEFAFLWPVSAGLLVLTLWLTLPRATSARGEAFAVADTGRHLLLLRYLRGAVLCTLALTVLGPVWHRPATTADAGAVAVVIDLRPTMLYRDRQRPPAERLQLAISLGLYTDEQAAREQAWFDEVAALQSVAIELAAARAASDFVDISRADPTLPRQRLRDAREELTRRCEAIVASPQHPAAAAVRRLPLGGDDLGTPAWLETARRRLAEANAAIAAERQRRYASAVSDGPEGIPAAAQAAADVAQFTRLDIARKLLAPRSALLTAAGRAVFVGAIDPAMPPDAPAWPADARQLARDARLAAGGDLRETVQSWLARSGGGRLRAVVVISDGANAADPSSAPLPLPTGIPVHTLCVASEQPPQRLELLDARVPPLVSVGQTFELAARVAARGVATAPVAAVRFTAGQFSETRDVRLGGEADADSALSPQGPSSNLLPNPPTRGGLSETVRWAITPQRPGELELRLDATADGLDPVTWSGRVRVSEDRQRVLVLSRAPDRQTLQLLRSLATRPLLHLQWLRMPDVAEQETPDATDPSPDRTPEAAIQAADAVVLAGVTPGELGEAAAAALSELLARRGGHVLLMSAERAMPAHTAPDATLAKWLTGGGKEAAGGGGEPSSGGRELSGGGVEPADDMAAARWLWWRSPAADGSLSALPTPQWPEQLVHADQWAVLPRLWRQVDLLPAERGAVTLLADAETGRRLLSVRQVGAGTVLWLHTDQAWRWTARPPGAPRGLTPPDPWSAVVRLLLEAPYAATAGRIGLDAPAYVGLGEPVRVRVRLPEAEGQRGDELPRRVLLRSGGRTVASAPLTPAERATGRIAGRFNAAMTPPEPGDYVVQLDGLESPRLTVTVGTRRTTPDPTSRPEVLAAWSAATGGVSVPATDLQPLLDRLAEAPTGPHAGEVAVRLWNSAWLATVLIGLLSAEWALRKHWGLA